MPKTGRQIAHTAKMQARRAEQRARIGGWLYMAPPTDPRHALRYAHLRTGKFYATQDMPR